MMRNKRQNEPRPRWLLAVMLIAVCLPLPSCKQIAPRDKSSDSASDEVKPASKKKFTFDDLRDERAVGVERRMAEQQQRANAASNE